jgi:hypothetical protein
MRKHQCYERIPQLVRWRPLHPHQQPAAVVVTTRPGVD